MNRGRRARLLLLALVALTLLRAGSCLYVKRSYPAPSAAEVVRAVLTRGARVTTLRAETRMSHRTSQGKVKATVRLMGQRGGKLRCDAVTPFDTPLITLVSDGTRFTLVDAQKNRHFHGPATPCNLARLLQVVLEPDAILTILGGSTPVIAHQQATLRWDDRAGAEVLSLRGEELTQTIRLDGTGRSWNLLLSEVRDRQDQVILRIEAGKYVKRAGLRVPTTIQISQPRYKTELEVQFKGQEINPSLPAAAFTLPSPDGLPSQRVDCNSEVKL